MSELGKKQKLATLRPKNSINVQQISGLFHKSGSTDVEISTHARMPGGNRNGIRHIPNNAQSGHAVRPLLHKSALNPVDLRKLNDYLSSAKKNAANPESDHQTFEDPSQGKVIGSETKLHKERENVIKKNKMSNPIANKTKSDQIYCIGPTPNLSDQAKTPHLITPSEEQAFDESTNKKKGMNKKYSQPITVVKSSDAFGEVDIDVVLSPTEMPRPLACSSKESVHTLGTWESTNAKPQQPLYEALKPNHLSSSNLTSSQLSLNSNNSGKVVSFSKVVLKKKLEGKSAKIPVVVLRRSKSDVQSSKNGSRESLMTSSEGSPLRKHKTAAAAAVVAGDASESVRSETEDAKISRRSTESLHRVSILEPVNGDCDSRCFVTERGVVMKISVHVDRKAPKSSSRHTVSSRSSKTASQSVSRESLHQRAEETDETNIGDTSRISSKSAETKATQTIVIANGEPITTSNAPIVEESEQPVETYQATNQNFDEDGNFQPSVTDLQSSQSLPPPQPPPPRRVRSCTTIHLAGIVDHDDQEISKLGMKLSEQLAETKTMLEYLIDEKNQNSSIYPKKVDEVRTLKQSASFKSQPNEQRIDSFHSRGNEFEHEIPLIQDSDEVGGSTQIKGGFGGTQNSKFYSHSQSSRDVGWDIKRKPTQVWNRQPREDKTSATNRRSGASYPYYPENELGHNAESQRPIGVIQGYWDRSKDKVNYTDRLVDTYNESCSFRTNRQLNYGREQQMKAPPQNPRNSRGSPIYYFSPVIQNLPVPKVASVENFSANPPSIVAPLLTGHDPSAANNYRYRGDPPTALKNYLNKSNVKSVLQRSCSNSSALKPTPFNPTSLYVGTRQNQTQNQQNTSSNLTNRSAFPRGNSEYPTFAPLNGRTLLSNPANYLLNRRNDAIDPERCQSCNSVIHVSPTTEKSAPDHGGLVGNAEYAGKNGWTSVAREFQTERLATIQQTTNAQRSSLSFAATDCADPRKYLSKYSTSSRMSNFG